MSSDVWFDSCSVVYYSTNELISKMWPDGAKSVTSVTKRPVTAGTEFKNSIITLVENLASKVSFRHYGIILSILAILAHSFNMQL